MKSQRRRGEGKEGETRQIVWSSWQLQKSSGSHHTVFCTVGYGLTKVPSTTSHRAVAKRARARTATSTQRLRSNKSRPARRGKAPSPHNMESSSFQLPVLSLSSDHATLAKELVDAAARYGFFFLRTPADPLAPSEVDHAFDLVRKRPSLSLPSPEQPKAIYA